jgi:hypothetical protein
MRLWCVWELYTFFAVRSDMDRMQIEFLSPGDNMDELAAFEVAHAHCYSPDDEARLCAIIEAGGAEAAAAVVVVGRRMRWMNSVWLIQPSRLLHTARLPLLPSRPAPPPARPPSRGVCTELFQVSLQRSVHAARSASVCMNNPEGGY